MYLSDSSYRGAAIRFDSYGFDFFWLLRPPYDNSYKSFHSENRNDYFIPKWMTA